MIARKFLVAAVCVTLLTLGGRVYNLHGIDSSSSCIAEAASRGADTSSNLPADQVHTILLKKITEKIHPTLPEYTFYVYGHKDSRGRDGYSVSNIVITKQGNNEEIIQKLTFSDTYSPDAENFGVHIEDLNFDGYKDLRIQEFLPAGPNIPYLYWLFDPVQKQYVPNKELEMIASPTVDYKNKRIISRTRSSASTYEKNIYQYIDGHIARTKWIETEIDPTHQVTHVTVKELKNGKTVITKYDKPIINLDEIEGLI